ncbi:sodium:solute symporter family protein [Oscillibacter sp. MSJ-2]|uniref:Sodium:solute symporter family protein n=1 Tax=Dysosmobacter acutus TaxID=2841504 RepID=A0ABS6F964_9FIRM|nr:sodium:solute symporter family protein [Dysosmobacter acutus]MBU5626826.1 sodium:solute symporter family protein [Dysosmobacter acutus]
MSTIGFVDIAVIFLYMVIMIGIGIMCGKKVKNSKDFTSAGQSLNLKLVVGSSIATCMGAGVIFGNFANVYKHGMSGYAQTLCYFIVGFPILILLSKPLRKSGATSIPEFLEMRYNKNTRSISSLCVLLMACSYTAAQFTAFGTTCEALGLTDRTTGALIGALVIVLFTVFSGLWGVTTTDTLQSVILIVGMAIIIPFISFHQAGGVEFVLANTDPDRLNVFKGMEPLTMLGYVLANVLAVSVDPAYSQRALAAKDAKTATRGLTIAGIIAFVTYVIVIMSVYCIPFIFPGLEDGSQYVPMLVSAYFPPVLKGLMLSAILGLLLTTGDSFLLIISSTLTDDVIPRFAPNMDSDRKLKLNRIIIPCSAVVILLLVMYWDDVFQLFRVGGSSYGAGVFFPLVLGVLWKKMNAKVANVAMLTGCLVSTIWDYTFNKATGIAGVILGSSICLIICVVGSLLSNKKGNEASEKSNEA